MAEILDVFATGYHEDARGDDRPCRWVVCVAVGDDRYLVDVQRDGWRYVITGWHKSEDDAHTPARPLEALDEYVCREVDDYMHGWR